MKRDLRLILITPFRMYTEILPYFADCRVMIYKE